MKKQAEPTFEESLAAAKALIKSKRGGPFGAMSEAEVRSTRTVLDAFARSDLGDSAMRRDAGRIAHGAAEEIERRRSKDSVTTGRG